MQVASEHTARVISDNWSRVQEQVAHACHQAGRDPQSVRIVGVTKYVTPELAHQLAQAGCRLLGENRPQLLWEKVAHFQSQPELTPPVQWHLIGHLQRNKLKRTLPMIRLLQSLDSLRLATATSQEACSQGMCLPVLLELNLTHDPSKTGMLPDQAEEILARAGKFPGIEIRGLMAMSSLEGDADVARGEFERACQLRDQWQQRYAGQVRLDELSMGMSGDFPAAIAAGATLVRIGSNLWRGLLPD